MLDDRVYPRTSPQAPVQAPVVSSAAMPADLDLGAERFGGYSR
jgi:hypothetical protein